LLIWTTLSTSSNHAPHTRAYIHSGMPQSQPPSREHTTHEKKKKIRVKRSGRRKRGDGGRQEKRRDIRLTPTLHFNMESGGSTQRRPPSQPTVHRATHRSTCTEERKGNACVHCISLEGKEGKKRDTPTPLDTHWQRAVQHSCSTHPPTFGRQERCPRRTLTGQQHREVVPVGSQSRTDLRGVRA
jgi:hypothetical protein